MSDLDAGILPDVELALVYALQVVRRVQDGRGLPSPFTADSDRAPPMPWQYRVEHALEIPLAMWRERQPQGGG